MLFSFLWVCICAMQLWQGATCQEEEGPRVDPEMRAHLEAKVMESMSLKDLEDMVERDERISRAPSARYVVIPKGSLLGQDDRDAIVIHRKPKKANRRSEEYLDFDRRYDDFRRDSTDGYFPFWASDLESAHSTPVRQFYESIVDKVMSGRGFDSFSGLDASASEGSPQYAPRFDHDAYAKDSTETKLQGKPYWKDAPERRDETVDENGCRTVVKRVVDPEDGKKTGPKSVVITKECEYPTLNGPDAKIAEAAPLRTPSRFAGYDDAGYEGGRPEELDIEQPEGRDPLKPDYIDSMLDKHFKSFPGFSNPLSSFRGYQDRFKLRIPDTFKDVKPTVGVQSYEYSDPKSGFDESSGDEHQRSEEGGEDGAKDPKMLKKSFAYYRKDNPKSDPDDKQYAEEYAQGNYRSFSSSYDSERDGPKKKSDSDQ